MSARHTPAKYKIRFLWPLEDYPQSQIDLALLVVAGLRRGELWLIQGPEDA